MLKGQLKLLMKEGSQKGMSKVVTSTSICTYDQLHVQCTRIEESYGLT